MGLAEDGPMMKSSRTGTRGRREDEFGPGTGNPNFHQQTHAHPGKHRLSDPREQYWKPAQTINVLSAMDFQTAA